MAVLVGMEVETRAIGERSIRLVKRQACKKANKPAKPAPLIKCLLSIYDLRHLPRNEMKGLTILVLGFVNQDLLFAMWVRNTVTTASRATCMHLPLATCYLLKS